MKLDTTLSVNWDIKVRFTNDSFAPDNRDLLEVLEASAGRPARCLVYLDQGVAAADPGLSRRIHAWFNAQGPERVQLAAVPRQVSGGEAIKNGLEIVEQGGRDCLEQGLCRHSYLIVIGGGAVLDAVGLGAALVHRGLRLVRLPTTVLAQDDAGLGVKNGVNAFANKNFFGTFQPPWAVVNDSRFLELLDDRSHRSGMAEAIKVALIKDADFLAWIIDKAEALARRDRESTVHLIKRCAELHLDHIINGDDPFETGSSRPLDFGHWSAHRLELLSEHRLNHGEAVAIGLAIDCCYAERIGRLPTELVEAVLSTLETLGFQLWDEVLELRDRHGARAVFAGLEQFREHLGGELTLAMPDGAGRQADIHELDRELCENGIRALRKRAAQRRARLPAAH
jgi:3-dehydroquinate synthase